VIRENAAFIMAGSNPQVVPARTPSVFGANLLQQPDNTPGNLGLMDITVSLAPALSGGGAPVSCQVTRSRDSATATCPGVSPGNYILRWRASGNYFTAEPVDKPVPVINLN
jgi:hypothetical protein